MAAETQSFRVGGDIVQVGDSIGSLLIKAGKPIHQHTYTIDTRNNTSISVTDYVYSVGNEIYTVTIREGRVSKITWERR
ncbi:DUF2845 domain-containing protein [Acinetobacter sp. SWAC5]|nr:DUF2845 domain-containing protein [Acinetobacter sp. SWAC5]